MGELHSLIDSCQIAQARGGAIPSGLAPGLDGSAKKSSIRVCICCGGARPAYPKHAGASDSPHVWSSLSCWGGLWPAEPTVCDNLFQRLDMVRPVIHNRPRSLPTGRYAVARGSTPRLGLGIHSRRGSTGLPTCIAHLDLTHRVLLVVWDVLVQRKPGTPRLPTLGMD